MRIKRIIKNRNTQVDKGRNKLLYANSSGKVRNYFIVDDAGNQIGIEIRDTVLIYQAPTMG